MGNRAGDVVIHLEIMAIRSSESKKWLFPIGKGGSAGAEPRGTCESWFWVEDG